MRVLKGLATLCDADPARGAAGRVLHDTFTCHHCNTLVEIPWRCSPEEAGGWCTRCDSVICASCKASGTCNTFEARLDLMERTITAHVELEHDLRNVT